MTPPPETEPTKPKSDPAAKTRWGMMAMLVVACAVVVGVMFALKPDKPEPVDERLASMDTPYYSAPAAAASINSDVLPIDDPAEQSRRFNLIRERYGVGHARGVLMALTVAKHKNALASLKHLGELEPDYERSVSQHVLADSLKAFDPGDTRFDDVAAKLLTKLADQSIDVYDPVDRLIVEANDYLALACMHRLVGKDHDALITKYIDNRLPLAEHHAAALRAMRERVANP